MILRDRDANSGWRAAADGTLEERRFYLQNWRADVSALCDTNGRPVERIKYSAYGTPITLTDIDFNSDGNLDPDDPGDFANTPYDWNLDGSTNGSDTTAFQAAYNAVSGNAWGRGYASLSGHGNRIGYAGYIYDRFISGSDGGKWHVRHRVLDSGLGRWTRRDPLGYVDGMTLFRYAGTDPLARLDPLGLEPCQTTEVGLSFAFSEGGTRIVPMFGIPWPISYELGFGFYGTLQQTWCPCANGGKQLTLTFSGTFNVEGWFGLAGRLPEDIFCPDPLSYCASGWAGGRIVGRLSGGFSGSGITHTCDGEDRQFTICTRAAVTIAGELGGEMSVRWRGWGPWIFGIVAYAQGTAWFGVYVTCAGTDCREWRVQLMGVSASVGVRYCFGAWCISRDLPLGEKTFTPFESTSNRGPR